MEKFTKKMETDEFGKSLIIRAPRIMHPPMETFIRYRFFILNNYIPRDETRFTIRWSLSLNY